MPTNWWKVAVGLALVGALLGTAQRGWAGAIFESVADTPCEESPCNPHPGNPRWHYLYALDNTNGTATVWGVEFRLPAGTIVPLATLPNWTRSDEDHGPFHYIILRANSLAAAVPPGQVLSGFHLNSDQGPGLIEVRLLHDDGGGLGTASLLGPTALAQPTLLLTLAGCKACSPGQEFLARARVLNPTGSAAPVEVKAGVILPNGTPINISALLSKHFETALPPNTDITVDLLRLPIPPGVPSGTYRYFGVFAMPEDGSTVSRTTQPFTVVAPY